MVLMMMFWSLIISLIFTINIHVGGADTAMIQTLCSKTRYRDACTQCLKTVKPPYTQNREGYVLASLICPASQCNTAGFLLVKRKHMETDPALTTAYDKCINSLLVTQNALRAAMEECWARNRHAALAHLKRAYNDFMSGCTGLRGLKVPPNVARVLADEKTLLLVVQDILNRFM
ncbi:hypothetical protein Dimus_011575 [Dionaea muscipula]